MPWMPVVDTGEAQQSSKESSALRKLAVQHFLQECLTPRARLSPIDASYCARFIRLLHNNGTPNFPSLHVYDKVNLRERQDRRYLVADTFFRS